MEKPKSVVFLLRLHTLYHGPTIATSNCILKLKSTDSASILKEKLRIKPDNPVAVEASGKVEPLKETPSLSPKPSSPLDAKLNGTNVGCVALAA